MPAEQTVIMGADERRRSESLSQQPMRPPAPIPGYEPELFLGRGAYGEVWVAKDRNTGCRVAIKFFTHRGGVDWSLLVREVEKLRFLKADRYVVQLHQVGWNADPPYYVMEYLESGSLEESLQDGPLGVAEAEALFHEVAQGLVHAHAKGILHCDLKPANILLDQDGKPRLADFGQARLTDEQSPALGTLFYMAPEQATMRGVPDARWDVYALGAVMYRMLTGVPPYRDTPGADDIPNTTRLEERLRRYRQFIQQAPRPDAHRRVAGVDGRLADIVDRCLATQPEKRLPTAQAVLDALDARSLQRARRPLLVLGVAGPALFLMVVAYFALHMLQTAVLQFRQEAVDHALNANRYAATIDAELVTREIARRRDALQRVANLHRFGPFLQLPAREGRKALPQKASELQASLDHVRTNTNNPEGSSWFLLDADGYLLGVSPLRETTKNKIGTESFAHRTYFHGGSRDYTKEAMTAMPTGRPRPLKHFAQSSVIRSTLDDKPVVVIFSVPVKRQARENGEEETIGVLGMAVRVSDLGKFMVEERDAAARWATLVETRKDWKQKEGRVLYHPYLKAHPGSNEGGGERYLAGAALARLAGNAEHHTLDDYQDPFHADDARYDDAWLAAYEPVKLDASADCPAMETGWAVIVQERASKVDEPVDNLRQRLVRQGLVALGAVVAILAGLWAFVVFVLNPPARSRLSRYLRHRAGLPLGSSTAGLGTGGSLPLAAANRTPSSSRETASAANRPAGRR